VSKTSRSALTAYKIFGLAKVLRLVFDTAALQPGFENKL
jgi:hypothetical protein